MKFLTKTKKIEGCTASFEIEIPQGEVDGMLVAICDEFAKVANIPGFRVGKAPADLVKKVYKKQASEEAMKRLIIDAYTKAFEEHKIDPLSLPEITDVYFEEGKPLSFKITVDIKPDVQVRNYKGVKIARKKMEIREEDIAKTLENLRILHAKYIAIEGRPLEIGDYAVCDVECSLEGKVLHQKRENFWVYVDKGSTMEALGEKMVGMKKGESRDCEVAIPETYSNKKIAGKTLTYHVVVKEIKERRVPELDDEFAKDLGKDSMEALKADIRIGLAKHLEDQVKKDMENQLFNKLVDENVFSVPSSFVDRQLRYLAQNAKNELIKKGFKAEDLNARDKEFEDRFKDEAMRRVRWFFILDAIATKEDIWCADSDLEDAFKAIARDDVQSPGEIKEYYEKENLVEDLKAKIRDEKAILFLLKEAVISDE